MFIKVKGLGNDIDFLLYSGLYKGKDGSLVPCLVMDTYVNMNCFTWSRKDTDWIFQGTCTTKSSRTGKDISIIINSDRMPSMRR